MLAKIKQRLSPPVFEDLEKTRQAAFLNAILWTFIFGNFLIALPVLLFPDPWPLLKFVGVAAVFFLFLRYLLVRGYVRTASVLTVSGVLVLATAVLALTGGISRPLVVMYPILIVTAATLLHPQAGFVVAAVSAIVITGLYLAEQNGALPDPLSPASLTSAWVQHIVFMLAFAVLAYLSTSSLRRTVWRAQQNEREAQQAVGKLRAIRETLKQRVAERTADLERRSRQIAAAAEVGRAAATIRDLDELLDKITRLVSERFGYYHVGVFLLDEVGEYAVLQAANSPGGQTMLARGHRLKVGETGIVGYVTAHRTPRIALDVGDEPVFFDNPDLPNTRSEMALPLIVGDQLLGALDIQSTKSAAFTQDSIQVLQVLADQVAIAVYNAQLYTQSMEALDALQRVQGEISREAWRRYLHSQAALAYRATERGEVRFSAEHWPPEMLETFSVGEITRHDACTLHIPITLRDQTLGVIRLRKREESRAWTDEEIRLMETLVDQLETALESARLYSDTRLQARRERTMQEMTDKLHRSLDMDDLLQTLLQEVSAALGAESAFVQLSAPPSGNRTINR